MLEDKLYHLDNPENTWNDIQVDDFPKTTEFLNQKWMEEKQDIIKQVLTDINLKKWFEKFLDESSQVLKIKCKKNLQNCQSLDAVKSIIAEVVWYKIWEVEMFWSLNILEHKKEEKVKAEEDEVKAEEDEVKGKEKNNIIIETNIVKKSQQAMSDAIIYIQKLKENHTNLDVWPWAPQYENIKRQLVEQWILKKLQDSGHDENFINNYILVQATFQEIKHNISEYSQDEISTFDKIVKNLDNACNIPDTNLNSFSSENITRTRHELFNSDIWNQDLINLKESNIKDKNSKMWTENSEYDEMFPEMSEKDLVQTYGKFLHKAAKPYLDRYNQHLANWTIDQYRQTNECKQFIQTINNIKLAFDNKTKDLVEELCIISQIKWMYMCMWEWVDFQMNKANEIESKDWILTLRGHIDWIDFSIRQDTNNPDARLQTSTKLDKQDNAFILWKDNFVDSKFILPSQSEVFNLAVKSVNSDWALQEAETPADYVSKLQAKIMSKMDDMYEDTKYVNHYMRDQVKWEQVMDKSLALVKNIKKSGIPTPITESNKGLFDFVGLIHFNIQNSTSLEKDRMNSCLEKIQNLVNEYKDTDKLPEKWKYSPIIEHYLTDKVILKNTETLLEWWVVEGGGESLFDLFSKYRDKSDQRSDWKFWMINFAFLENDLTPNKPSYSQIAQEYDAEREKDNADGDLELNLAGIENDVSSVASGVYANAFA